VLIWLKISLRVAGKSSIVRLGLIGEGGRGIGRREGRLTFGVEPEDGVQAGLHLAELELVVCLQQLGEDVGDAVEVLHGAVLADCGQVLDRSLPDLRDRGEKVRWLSHLAKLASLA